MATLRLRLLGELRDISWRSLRDVSAHSLSIIDDLDSAISGDPQGTLDWVIADAHGGSLVLEVESRPKKRPTVQVSANEIASAFVTGLAQIEREGTSPAYFSEATMRRAQQLVRLVGVDGVTELMITDLSNEATITSQAIKNIAPLTSLRRRSVGSVQGRIEMISIHGPQRFIVYEGRTRKAITCRFSDKDWLQKAYDVLGRRVRVAGIVHYNAKSEPMRIEPTDIRVLREESELPKTEDLTGSDPDFTGNMTTEEFIRSIRGG